MSHKGPHVTVLGSINLDLSARTPRFPLSGETVEGDSFEEQPGGKGANQAVGVARLGARCQMIGRIGKDRFGEQALTNLRAAGVDLTAVASDDSVSSGVAIIVVDDEGQNRIVIIPGANGRVDEEELARLDEVLPDTSMLMLQLELPMNVVVAAIRAARLAGVPVMLDPAPAPPGDLPTEAYDEGVLLTPNEGEAAALVGFDVDDESSALRALRALRQRGAGTVVITRGEHGVCWSGAAGEGVVSAVAVRSVDSVGAGDAFNAALAVGLVSGLSLESAVGRARDAGSIAVQTVGAQQAMPTAVQLDDAGAGNS